jgi:hypothetical protein
MPTDSIVVVIAITAVFVVFAVVLMGVDFYSSKR